MIDLSQEAIVTLLLRSFLCGVLLGVAYDGIRTLKMFFGIRYGKDAGIPSGRARKIIAYAVTFITDIVFWLLVGVCSIALMYTVGGGVFRGVTYLALAFGFLIYYLTLGRLVLKISALLTAFVKRVFARLLGIILYPIKWLFGAIISLWHLTIGKIIGKIIRELVRRNSRGATDAQDEKLPLENGGGEEEYVYVGSKGRYRKSGRIDFGRSSGKRAEP